MWCGAGEAVLVEQCTSRGLPHARGFLCLWLAQPIRAVTWGTAPLALKPIAKCHFASASAGWALLCDLMQNTKEMESTGTRCEALCIPIHLRIVCFNSLALQISIWLLLPPGRTELGFFEALELFYAKCLML